MVINFAKPDSAADLKTSYKVLLALAKHGKVFQHRKSIKDSVIKMALSYGDKKNSPKI